MLYMYLGSYIFSVTFLYRTPGKVLEQCYVVYIGFLSLELPVM